MDRYIFLPKEDGVLKGLNAPILLDSYMSEFEIIDSIKEKYDLDIQNITPIKNGKHIFSHQLWNIKAYIAYARDLKDYPSYSIEEINTQIALPSAYKKFLPF
jgi:A/G-specific adenine glycosylase